MRSFFKFMPLLILLLLALSSIAQPKNAIMIDDSNVMSFFSEQYGDEAKEIYNSDPEIINQMKEFINSSIYLIQNRNEPNHISTKLSDFPIVSKKSYNSGDFSPSKFNPFKYGLDKLKDKTIIHIDNTNYVVIVEPNK